MTLHVALFGGSFNPPHVGHVLAVAYVLAVEPVDRVLVVPVWSHPFNKDLEPFEHRVAMSRSALAGIVGVTVSELESELGSPSRTLRTVERLLTDHPEWRLRLMIGADVVDETDQWYAFDRIKERAPPLILGRVGYSAPEAPPAVLPAISSSELRSALATAGVDSPLVARFVPRSVRQYIREHGLYR